MEKAEKIILISFMIILSLSFLAYASFRTAKVIEPSDIEARNNLATEILEGTVISIDPLQDPDPGRCYQKTFFNFQITKVIRTKNNLAAGQTIKIEFTPEQTPLNNDCETNKKLTNIQENQNIKVYLARNYDDSYFLRLEGHSVESI